jgi:arylsulfatase A
MLSRRAFLASAAAAVTAAKVSPPNIVILFADDLGYGDLGCYGSPHIRTPHLDQLAREGLRFTQFYSASPFCTPSRSALLTGRLPIRNGLNVVLFPDSTGGIPATEITLGELLQKQGYATAIVGKWHLGHRPEHLPIRHGFDSYFGIPYSNDMSPATSQNARKDTWPKTPLIRDEKIIEEEPDQSQLTQRYTQEAVSFLKASVKAKKPFFLYMPHTMPHWPLAASANFRGKSARGLYGDAVEEVDWSVGEILRTLRDLKQHTNTFVFFSSDNGPARYLREEGGSAGPLRDGKGSTWEGGQREPAIAWWPGKIKPAVTPAFGTMMDLFPTIAGLAAASLPSDRVYDGVSLAPVLFNGAPGREPLLFHYNQGALRAVRKGKWKLHIETNSALPKRIPYRKEPQPLLYNLDSDTAEEWNVAAAHPGIVRELLALIDQHKASFTPGPPLQ